MPLIEASHELSAKPQQIWDLIVDFGNIEAWWPTGGAVDIERVDLEGEGIGMTRHIYNVGMPAAVSERLDALDPESLSWKLSIVGDRPAGLTQYQATGSLEPLPQGGTRIHYRGEFETTPGNEEGARAFLLGAYALMFEGLEQTAGQHNT